MDFQFVPVYTEHYSVYTDKNSVYNDNSVVNVFCMPYFHSMYNIINITPSYKDIQRGSECIRHSLLWIIMAKVRRNNLTLDEKINLIDASRYPAKPSFSHPCDVIRVASRTHSQLLLVE